MVCVATILTLVAACSGNPEPTRTPDNPSNERNSSVETQIPPSRAVNTVVPTVRDDVNLMTSYSITVGANTLYCNPATPHLELALNGDTKGFQEGTIKTQLFDTGLVRINWDEMAARSIIVNKQLWAPIDVLANPPIATLLYPQNWGGKITSIDACNWM